MTAESKTHRKVDLTGPDWMLAALKLACVCDVVGHKCIECQVHDHLVKLERDLSRALAERDEAKEAAQRYLNALVECGCNGRCAVNGYVGEQCSRCAALSPPVERGEGDK